MKTIKLKLKLMRKIFWKKIENNKIIIIINNSMKKIIKIIKNNLMKKNEKNKIEVENMDRKMKR